MLPILRTISVGGVLLAITILGLALTPPGTPQRRFVSIDPPARGALIDQRQHPEWRHFIIQAALRRADAIDGLRELPDTPTRLPRIPDVAPPYVTPVFPEVWSGEKSQQAGLPAPDENPADVTGSVSVAPAPIPIEIGEPSSTELPAISPDDKPPAIRLPVSEAPANEPTVNASLNVSAAEAVKKAEPQAETHKKIVRHRRVARTKPEAPPATFVPPPFNIIQAIIESLLKQPAAANKPAEKQSTSASQQRTTRAELR